ncbi:MAG: hypothetical protein IKA79_08205 [Lentisphaeria bacterium]|nr:hypothetical protein [Lentisphaeria bacterium]
MAALTANRNTQEILCHSQKFRRIRNVKNGYNLFVGSIAAVDSLTGTALPASDSPGLIVLGRAEGFAADGRIVIKSGMFKYDNAADAEKLGNEDINHVVYIVDDHTLGRIGGSNKIPAGVLREIDSDGMLIVEIGNLALTNA